MYRQQIIVAFFKAFLCNIRKVRTLLGQRPTFSVSYLNATILSVVTTALEKLACGSNETGKLLTTELSDINLRPV